MDRVTKQEEIREGIARLSLRGNAVFMGKLPSQCYRFADEVIAYLHSQGAVIKVASVVGNDREYDNVVAVEPLWIDTE